MTLIVSSLSDMPEVIVRRRPSHLVSLLDPVVMIETPPGFDPAHHLRIGVGDISEPVEGLVMADATMIERLIVFGGEWDGRAPMLLHCQAGISRSTAAAFTLACARNPHFPEAVIARALRRAAPHAYPNRRIVALSDELLGRRGRMIGAIEAIGANDLTSLAAPFDLPARYGQMAGGA